MTGSSTRLGALRRRDRRQRQIHRSPVPELYQLIQDPANSATRPVRPRAWTCFRKRSRRSTRRCLTAGGRIRQRERAAAFARLRSRGPGARREETFTDEDDQTPDGSDRDLHAANDFYTNRRYPEAIAMFDRVIARRPDLADAYRYKAYVYWQMGQPADAIKTLETTVTLGISDQDMRTRLATFLAETGQPQKAISLLTTLPTDDVEAQNALGIAYGQAGKNAEALQTFEKVLAVDATNGIALRTSARSSSARTRPRRPRRGCRRR